MFFDPEGRQRHWLLRLQLFLCLQKRRLGSWMAVEITYITTRTASVDKWWRHAVCTSGLASFQPKQCFVIIYPRNQLETKCAFRKRKGGIGGFLCWGVTVKMWRTWTNPNRARTATHRMMLDWLVSSQKGWGGHWVGGCTEVLRHVRLYNKFLGYIYNPDSKKEDGVEIVKKNRMQWFQICSKRYLLFNLTLFIVNMLQ